MVRKRRKIKRHHQHIAVYLVLASLPVVAYLLTLSGDHLSGIELGLDQGLSFLDRLAARLTQSINELVTLGSTVIALIYTYKVVFKR